jgi:hypothetical protein
MSGRVIAAFLIARRFWLGGIRKVLKERVPFYRWKHNSNIEFFNPPITPYVCSRIDLANAFESVQFLFTETTLRSTIQTEDLRNNPKSASRVRSAAGPYFHQPDRVGSMASRQ